VLDITEQAADVIRELLAAAALDAAEVGLRFSRDPRHGSLALQPHAGPVDGDTTLRRRQIALYLDDYALRRTHRQLLDTSADDGERRLFLRDTDLVRRNRQTVAALRAYLER
jgi:hypothetical protein